MSDKTSIEDDDSSDSEHVQTDHELLLLTNHSTSEPASSQTALSRSFPISTELTPQIMSHMMPRGISSVVKPLLEMTYLISHYAATMAQLVESLTAWVRAHKKQTTLIVTGITLLAFHLAVPAILGAIGFSATGPVLGSVAAGWQASLGSVASGSVFSFFQSAAMGGAAMGVSTGIGVLGAVIAVGGGLATVPVVKERCRKFVEETATVVKGGCQKVMAETGNLWRNFRNPFSKKSKYHGE